MVLRAGGTFGSNLYGLPRILYVKESTIVKHAQYPIPTSVVRLGTSRIAIYKNSAFLGEASRGFAHFFAIRNSADLNARRQLSAVPNTSVKNRKP